MLVHENECLVECNVFLQQKQATKFAYKLRPGSDDEIVSRDRVAVNP